MGLFPFFPDNSYILVICLFFRMSAKKEFLNFCRQIGGTSDAKKETIVCRFPEFHELQEIDVSSQEMQP